MNGIMQVIQTTIIVIVLILSITHVSIKERNASLLISEDILVSGTLIDNFPVSLSNDNNIYSNYNDTTFSTGSVHLKKLVDYSISYELGTDLEIENPISQYLQTLNSYLLHYLYSNYLDY